MGLWFPTRGCHRCCCALGCLRYRQKWCRLDESCSTQGGTLNSGLSLATSSTRSACWSLSTSPAAQQATDLEELPASNNEDLAAYLGGGAIPGVGPVYARVRWANAAG